MAMEPLDAEIATAAVGLEPILRGTPSWATKYQDDFAQFKKRARQFILRALQNREPDADVEELAFDYDEARKLLDADDEEIERRHNELYDALPDDIQDDVQAAATHAIEYLQGAIPRLAIKTTARLDMAPPEPFALDRFARQWRVVVDPMSALRAFAEGSLDMVQVEALQEAYPEIYKLIADPDGGGLLDEAIASMKARKGDRWDVTDDQDRQIKILIGAPPVDLELAADYAASQPIAPAPQPKAPSRKTVRPADELLPGQKQG